jgi:hypothetical protein
MSTKPTIQPTILDIGTLNAISLRLSERAEQISQITLQDLALDLRLASRACDKLSSLRFRIAEIAEKALTQDGGATHRDLRALLECPGQEG